MLGAPDAVLHDLCQAEPGGVFVGHVRRNRRAVNGLRTDILLMSRAKRDPVPEANTLDPRPDGNDLPGKAVAGIEGVFDPGIPMCPRVKQAAEDDALGPRADERSPRPDENLARAGIADRLGTHLERVLAGKDDVERL